VLLRTLHLAFEQKQPDKAYVGGNARWS